MSHFTARGIAEGAALRGIGKDFLHLGGVLRPDLAGLGLGIGELRPLEPLGRGEDDQTLGKIVKKTGSLPRFLVINQHTM